MDFERVEKLIKLLQQYELGELQVKEGAFEFCARRGEKAPPVAAPVTAAHAAPVPALTPAPASGLKEITSPLVGTFYRAPAPDQPPYREVGDRVNPDDIVCIVEAMKVMNEIKANVSGTIRKVVVENATAVEYGQPLFEVEVG
jgi:acetyl-CoA carboxylase biotin carboxyl carrier protein